MVETLRNRDSSAEGRPKGKLVGILEMQDPGPQARGSCYRWLLESSMNGSGASAAGGYQLMRREQTGIRPVERGL